MIRAIFAFRYGPQSWRPMVISALALVTLGAAANAQAPALPVEIRQHATPFNYVSPAGMPISSDATDPGSDGRLPTLEEQAARGLTDNPPTAGQFQGLVSFGAVVRTRLPEGVSYTTYSGYAVNVLLHGEVSGQQVFMARAQVGSPYISRQVQFLFGSIVQAPDRDEHGTPLEDLDPPLTPEDYWLREPYWPSGQIVNRVHEGAPYYWSPHARAVFATQPGPIQITWRRAAPLTTEDPGIDYDAHPDFAVVAGRVYPLLSESYIVSGSAAKEPRRMYWTEETFRSSGIPVEVPEGVTTNFIYTENFPRTVEEAYQDPGSSQPVPPEGGEVFSERRTIFFNQNTGAIHAYNWQGRILLELLGDDLGDDRREHLGVEVVDVVRRVNPADVTTELGEPVRAWQDGANDDSHLMPQLLLRPREHEFVFQYLAEGGRPRMYAIRETRNLNDVLLHWTEEGLEGLRWPHRFARYKFIWPDDVSRYSHYVRPPVQTEAEARETAVTLPIENVPIIDYQDPLDRPRGKLTETFAYYTFLEPEFPAHRALLRFTSGEHIAFELVFSWLASDLTVDGDGNLRAEGRLAEWLGAPGGSHPPRLSSWDPVQGMFNLPDMFAAPRVVESTVEVAQRIEAPGGEVPPGQIYWAGHIRREIGQSFNPFIYADPFVDGFDNANLSAIVPVNAIPGENKLEVWWFRANHADLTRGFQPIFWPSVIGRYTIEWPADAREIVLASNHGSGPLGSREAAGHIYYQNDPSLPGYNPNEEHALMVGGQAYALRDDLNIVGPGENYSSEPYVLIEYVDATGRPNMSAFRVLREKPEAGWVFDYVVEAGTILQAPMPLPLLPAPVEGSGAQAVNYNTEPEPEGGLGDLPVNWDPAVHGDGPLGHYGRFTFLDRNNAFWVYRGLHAGTPPLEAGSYDAATETFVAPVPAQVREGEAFRYVLHASQRPEALRLETAGETPLPDGLTINGLALEGAPWMKVGEYELTFILSSIVDGSSVELDWTLAIVTSVQNRL